MEVTDKQIVLHGENDAYQVKSTLSPSDVKLLEMEVGLTLTIPEDAPSIDNYTLGVGGYALVLLAQNARSRAWHCVKVQNNEARSKAEVEIWQNLQDAKHIMPLLDHGSETLGTTQVWFQVMPIASLGCVAEFEDGFGTLSRDTQQQLLAAVSEGTLQGLNAMHTRGISHGDVKPENLLVTREGHVLLTDFGLSKRASQEFSAKGTLDFLPPEFYVWQYGKGERPDGKSVDVWAAGLTLITLACGYPFDKIDASIKKLNCRSTKRHMEMAIRDYFVSRLDQISSRHVDYLHLAKWLVAIEPTDRPSIASVLHHRWLKQEGNQMTSQALEELSARQRQRPTDTTATDSCPPVGRYA